MKPYLYHADSSTAVLNEEAGGAQTTQQLYLQEDVSSG